MKCKLKKIICLIGDTKSRVWLPFRYPVGISALKRIEHERIFEHKRYITFKK